MCAGGQYWAGIGRLVFALSSEQLIDLVPPGTPTLRLSSREVFARGNVPITVEGPCDELADRGGGDLRRVLGRFNLSAGRPARRDVLVVVVQVEGEPAAVGARRRPDPTLGERLLEAVTADGHDGRAGGLEPEAGTQPVGEPDVVIVDRLHPDLGERAPAS